MLDTYLAGLNESVRVGIDGKTIKRLRKDLALSTDQLAAALEVGKSTLQKWEAGETEGTELKNVKSMAKALGVPVEYLLSSVQRAEYTSIAMAMETKRRRELQREPGIESAQAGLNTSNFDAAHEASVRSLGRRRGEGVIEYTLRFAAAVNREVSWLKGEAVRLRTSHRSTLPAAVAMMDVELAARLMDMKQRSDSVAIAIGEQGLDIDVAALSSIILPILLPADDSQYTVSDYYCIVGIARSLARMMSTLDHTVDKFRLYMLVGHVQQMLGRVDETVVYYKDQAYGMLECAHIREQMGDETAAKARIRLLIRLCCSNCRDRHKELIALSDESARRTGDWEPALFARLCAACCHFRDASHGEAGIGFLQDFSGIRDRYAHRVRNGRLDEMQFFRHVMELGYRLRSRTWMPKTDSELLECRYLSTVCKTIEIGDLAFLHYISAKYHSSSRRRGYSEVCAADSSIALSLMLQSSLKYNCMYDRESIISELSAGI